MISGKGGIDVNVLYENIDQILPNKLHGPMHYKKLLHVYTMDTCSVVITWQYYPSISQFNSPCNEFTSVWSMFLYTTCDITFSVIFKFNRHGGFFMQVS